MKKKLNLEELKIESFLTSSDFTKEETPNIKGGTDAVIESALVSVAAGSGYALGYVIGEISDYASNAASIGDREDMSDYISQMLPSVRTLCPCW